MKVYAASYSKSTRSLQPVKSIELLIHDKAHLECFVLTTAVKRNFECVVIRHKCPHNPLQSMTDKWYYVFLLFHGFI